MDCKKAREMAADDASGALDPAGKAELEAHLKGCEACRREAELLSKAWQALDKYVAPELGADFVDSLMEKIKAGQAAEQDEAFSFAGWWKVPALALASCAVYLVCIETGLMPSRQYVPEAQDAAGSISGIFSESQEPGGGSLLNLVEGADQ